MRRPTLTSLALLPLLTACRGQSESKRVDASSQLEPAETRQAPRDLDDRSVDPLAPDGRADLLLFVRTDCPISNRYAPELARIASLYTAAPLDVWLIYVDPDESPEQIREHIAAYSLPGRPLRDPGQALVPRARVRVSPEAALFDAQGELRYHGRIDDWYVDYGKSRAEPSSHDLTDAIDALLAGRAIAQTQTEAVGCPLPPLGEPRTQPASEEAPTEEAPTEEAPVLDLAAAAAIVAASGREAGDLETDLRRKPAELLAFMQLRAGMKAADIGAGTGYTTELLARALGPSGRVYGQNSPFVLDRFARDGWKARLAKPVNATVVSLEREFDDPFPADIEPLDLVVNVLFYHDFEWQGIDRPAHLADVFAALRPGGSYVIIDASAAAGHGVSDSQSLHRIEESVLIAELEAAGFRLDRRGEFLRNPGDTRDWNALPWRSPEQTERGEFSDKFVLSFVRPR